MQAKAISFFIALYFIVIAIAAPTPSGNTKRAEEQSGKGNGGISSVTGLIDELEGRRDISSVAGLLRGLRGPGGPGGLGGLGGLGELSGSGGFDGHGFSGPDFSGLRGPSGFGGPGRRGSSVTGAGPAGDEKKS